MASPAEEDQELAGAALAGDRAAVEELLRRHHRPLFALCRRMTGNDADAADATQEALIAIARGLANGRFDGRSRFTTWAFRVATNATLDELRRRRRRPVPAEDEQLQLAARPSALGGGISEDAVAARLDIDAALLRLPLEYRAAVVLRDLCRLDYAEVAEVLDVPLGTVRSRIARGRAALTALLGNQAPSTTRPSSGR